MKPAKIHQAPALSDKASKLKALLRPARQENAENSAPAAPSSARPKIPVTTEEDQVNSQAAASLARDPTLFQRGGQLVRVMRDESPAASGIRRRFGSRVELLPPAVLRERMAANARWVYVSIS